MVVTDLTDYSLLCLYRDHCPLYLRNTEAGITHRYL